MLVGVYIDGTSMGISGDTQAAMWTSELWAKGAKSFLLCIITCAKGLPKA